MTRAGFTFIEVLLAALIVAIGVMGTFQLLGAFYDKVAPGGPWGGLRRYIRAEELLRAQTEGLRALRTISPVAASNLIVQPDPDAGYEVLLSLSREPVRRIHGQDGRASFQQHFYVDVTVRHRGQAVGTLSVSTLRSEVLGQYEKIGL